jgi:segregation and condensation protein A
VCALSVTLPEFSGPLDLLYGLIQKRRLDVNAVSLAAVADQYLEQVFALDGGLEALSEFLQLGSQLLLIKSRTLLPAPLQEGDAEDLAEALRHRLQEYEVLRAAAGWLAERENRAERMWPRGSAVEAPAGDLRLAPLTIDRFQRLLTVRSPGAVRKAALVEMVPRPTIRERAEVVLAVVGRERWTDLRDVLGSDLSAAVATFLAVLILVRRGWLTVRQSEPYAQVSIRRLVDAVDAIGPLDE